MTTTTGCQYGLSAAFACATTRKLIGNYAANYQAIIYRHWLQDRALLALMNTGNASVKRYQRVSDKALLALMNNSNASVKRSGLTCINSWNITSNRTFLPCPDPAAARLNTGSFSKSAPVSAAHCPVAAKPP